MRLVVGSVSGIARGGGGCLVSTRVVAQETKRVLMAQEGRPTVSQLPAGAIRGKAVGCSEEMEPVFWCFSTIRLLPCGL